jgi:hypothetical protein
MVVIGYFYFTIVIGSLSSYSINVDHLQLTSTVTFIAIDTFSDLIYVSHSFLCHIPLFIVSLLLIPTLFSEVFTLFKHAVIFSLKFMYYAARNGCYV